MIWHASAAPAPAASCANTDGAARALRDSALWCPSSGSGTFCAACPCAPSSSSSSSSSCSRLRGSWLRICTNVACPAALCCLCSISSCHSFHERLSTRDSPTEVAAAGEGAKTATAGAPDASGSPTGCTPAVLPPPPPLRGGGGPRRGLGVVSNIVVLMAGCHRSAHSYCSPKGI
eukprot:COSAG01_NODE_843_length_13172_cov_84.009791_1_plen_175_part_00